MQIGIVGNGYVGNATSLLKSDDVKVFIYDRDNEKCSPLGLKLREIACCDFIFVCVPTPMSDDGSCHINIVESVVSDLEDAGARLRDIVIRSTVPVGTARSLGVNFMPEFLTEANWENDFVENKNWIVGLDDSCKENQEKFRKLFKMVKAGGKIKSSVCHFCSSEEAELIKYTRNCFLATKVSFFNEIERFCEKKDLNYEAVRLLVGLDKRVGASHTAVPGPDGKRGFGGTCFPKDMGALLYQMQAEQNLESYIIEAALARNNQVDRPEQDWAADKGRAVV
jgi:UDPglucose 6-dehydrogenase